MGKWNENNSVLLDNPNHSSFGLLFACFTQDDNMTGLFPLTVISPVSGYLPTTERLLFCVVLFSCVYNECGCSHHRVSLLVRDMR